jgi:hypothetical protein
MSCLSLVLTVRTFGLMVLAQSAAQTRQFGNIYMPKPRFTEEQTRAKIREMSIIRDLCQAEQDGHREMIRRLKKAQKDELDLVKKRFSAARSRVDKVNTLDKSNALNTEIEKEIQWRKIQIQILECDRNGAHVMIKYHSKRITNEPEILCT